MLTVDWTTTLFDGLIGSCIAVVGTFVVAFIVFGKQSRADRTHYEKQRVNDLSQFERVRRAQWDLYEKGVEEDRRQSRLDRKWTQLNLGMRELQQTLVLGQESIGAPDDSAAFEKWHEMRNSFAQMFITLMTADGQFVYSYADSWLAIAGRVTTDRSEGRRLADALSNELIRFQNALTQKVITMSLEEDALLT